MNKVQFLFLPQIRRTGCNEFITTFAPASARFSGLVFSKNRSEFCFTMKQNFPCQLRGSRAVSKQPMNARNGRRSVRTDRRLKVSLSIFVSPVLAQIRHWPVRKSHSFLAAIFFGTLMANLETHDGQGRIKVRFDKFPQGGKSPHLGKYFCGVIEPTANRRSNSHQ